MAHSVTDLQRRISLTEGSEWNQRVFCCSKTTNINTKWLHWSQGKSSPVLHHCIQSQTVTEVSNFIEENRAKVLGGFTKAICAVTKGYTASNLKPILIISGCVPCYPLSLDRNAEWNFNIVWMYGVHGLGRKKSFIAQYFLSLPSIIFIILISFALQGFNIARGYNRWGMSGWWKSTGLWFSKGKKEKRRIKRILRKTAGAVGYKSSGVPVNLMIYWK